MQTPVLRKATPEDEPFLIELFMDVRGDELRLTGLPEPQILQLMTIQYNAQKQSYDGNYPNAENFIIESDSAPVGRMLTDRSTDCTRLVDISVLSTMRDKGIGSFCLEGLKEVSEKILLQVFSQNLGAIRLYRRHGFESTSEGGMYLEMEWRQ
jgi:ribosomal protein S18 acetylase RimI-like enzyme